jgi:hypothetical protein
VEEAIFMTKYLLPATIIALLVMPFVAAAADTERQADVAKRGADVMPFSLKATTHIFTKTSDGGTQRVIAKDTSDARQIQMVREHLRHIQAEFQQGAFAGPSHVHGVEMPGLAELKAAKPGAIAIVYRDVTSGAELLYKTADGGLVSALHTWFDAQVSDHGDDAMAGHMHHGDTPNQ